MYVSEQEIKKLQDLAGVMSESKTNLTPEAEKIANEIGKFIMLNMLGPNLNGPAFKQIGSNGVSTKIRPLISSLAEYIASIKAIDAEAAKK